MNPDLIAYTAVAAVLTITPGADTMLVIRNVLSRGPKAGVFTTLGISSGLFVHATLSALGLSLILVRSAAAFDAVKLVGAAYLVYLGLRSIFQAARPGAMEPAGGERLSASGIKLPPWRSTAEGFLTNVLNPKVAVFYLAFLPQFIRAGDPVLGKSLLLAGIHCLLGLVWLSIVSAFVGRMRVFLTRPAMRKGLEALSGAILIGFGVRLALARR
jgi:threonine/homoserine/homoserine lactone efflux protein